MSTAATNLPLVLLILDGWGIAPSSRGNAITSSHTPFFNQLIKEYPTFSVAAGGEAVGLPWGEAGNSEVGHLNLGAGKIVYQPILKINKSIEDNSFFTNEVLTAALKHCREHTTSLHLLGLFSEGGVHSHQDHLYALLELAARSGLKRIYLHLILDGRDTAFDSGLKYITQLERVMQQTGVGKIATVIGRFYAMDRDNQWERTSQAYAALVKADGAPVHSSAVEAVQASYDNKVYDEEMLPVIIAGNNPAESRIQSGDAVIFFNYRPDRARQLTKAFVLPTFTKFDRTYLSDIEFVTLVEYEPDLPVHVAFPKEKIETPIARVWSEAGLTQLHVAETEKYAHVTYFFNGGKDVVFPGEDNVIVPSAGVASYADKPEMSAGQITDQVTESLQQGKHHCYVVNFANADMVGHTGNLRAAIRAIEYLDTMINKVVTTVASRGGVTVITADHGNAEEMVNYEDGTILKEHSALPVPCAIVGERFKLATPRPDSFQLSDLPVTGVLSDITPTILDIMGLPKPAEMTSRSLLNS